MTWTTVGLLLCLLLPADFGVPPRPNGKWKPRLPLFEPSPRATSTGASAAGGGVSSIADGGGERVSGCRESGIGSAAPSSVRALTGEAGSEAAAAVSATSHSRAI
jgi:hypothetical protein